MNSSSSNNNVGSEMSWSRYRHRYPYEQANQVGLDFNYWVTNRYLNVDSVIDLLESCIFPSFPSNKPDPLKPLPPCIQNTICLFLEDFDPLYYTEFSSFLPFFSQSTSVPIISAKIDTIKRELALAAASAAASAAAASTTTSTKNNTPIIPSLPNMSANTSNSNAWFWNDVKHIPSLLFWPKAAFNFLTSTIPNSLIPRFDAFDLFFSYQIAWQCLHNNSADIILFTPEQYSDESLAVIIDGAKTAFLFNQMQDDPIYHYFFEQTNDSKSIVFGSFFVPKTNSTGFYLGKIPRNSSSHSIMGKLGKQIILVLIWQSGVIDVLFEDLSSDDDETLTMNSPSDSHFVNQSLSFRNHNPNQPSGSSTEDENMKLSIISLRPLKYLDPIAIVPASNPADSNTTTAPVTENASLVPGLLLEDSSLLNKEATTVSGNSSQQLPSQNSLKILDSLKVNYEQAKLTFSDFTPFLLSGEVLEMMGYLLSNTYVQFLDTSDPIQWKFPSDQPFLPAQQQKLEISSNHSQHLRFHALEDGEDLEEGEEVEMKEQITPVPQILLPRLIEKLKQQAFQLYPFESFHFQTPCIGSVASLFPLDLCAIDCEMCSTRDGLELTRVTIIHPVLGVILDTLVKPKLEIIDYHTEFSGVTAESLGNITINLQDIQQFLPFIISPNTILIGHSLDNDLKALRIVHRKVIDTAALFPHPLGIPHKIGLKKLAKDYLQLEIQDGAEGHDSIQDAVTSFELLLLQVKYWKYNKAQSSSNDGHTPVPVNNEAMLLKQSESTTTSTSTSTKNNQFLKFTLLDYLFYRQQFRAEQQEEFIAGNGEETGGNGGKTTNNATSIHISQQLIYANKPNWERSAFGYKSDGDISSIIETFQSQLQDTHYNAVCSSSVCTDWKKVFSSLQEHQQQQLINAKANHRRHIMFGCMNFQTEIESELTALRSPHLMNIVNEPEGDSSNKTNNNSNNSNDDSADEQRASKRTKLDPSSSSASSSEFVNLTSIQKKMNIFEEINKSLEQFYQSLPENTMLLVFTQKNLKEMRKLIAKKIRYKWDNAMINVPQPATTTATAINTTTTTTTAGSSPPLNNNNSSAAAAVAGSNDNKKKLMRKPKVVIPLKYGVPTLGNNNNNNNNSSSNNNKRSHSQTTSGGGNSGGVIGYDWDPLSDENKLIEETNRVAACSLFIRYK